MPSLSSHYVKSGIYKNNSVVVLSRTITKSLLNLGLSENEMLRPTGVLVPLSRLPELKNVSSRRQNFPLLERAGSRIAGRYIAILGVSDSQYRTWRVQPKTSCTYEVTKFEIPLPLPSPTIVHPCRPVLPSLVGGYVLSRYCTRIIIREVETPNSSY